MKRIIILSILAVLSCWIGGFFYYINYTKSYKINTSTLTDAIVVFTGGRQRIQTGINLLKAGYAPILFIAGIDSPNQLKNFLTEQQISSDRVIYGLTAATNQNNAREIADFISTHSITSVRLVTFFYHMPTALEETSRLVRPSTIIIPHPVFPSQLAYIILFKEYNKYLAIIFLKYFGKA